MTAHYCAEIFCRMPRLLRRLNRLPSIRHGTEAHTDLPRHTEKDQTKRRTIARTQQPTPSNVTLKTVVKNAGWLGLIQVLNYVIPVLTLPVVTRAFGPSIFGILASLNAYAAYVSVFTGYGFPVTGPRAIAGLHRDALSLSKTVSAIVGAQFLLGVVASVIFFTGIPIIPHGGEYRLVGLILLVQMFATAAAPQWVFIGLEQARDFALVQLVFRTLAAAFIVFAIRTPDDLLLYVIVNCIAAIAILLVSLIGLTQYNIRWQVPAVAELVLAIRQATRLFFSSVSISLYTTTNVLIVAFVLGPSAAGTFALADRVRSATGGIIGPITQAVYPFVCRIAGREQTHEEAWTRRIFFRAIVLLAALISLSVFALAPLIIWLLGGNAFQAAIPVLRMMAFLPVIIALSTTLGYQTMIPLHMDREFSWVVTSAALLGVTGVFVLTYHFGLLGAALTMLAVETYVTVAFAILVQRRMSILSLFFRHP